MSRLSTSDRCLLLPGRALLRHAGGLAEEVQGESWDGALSSLESLLGSGRTGRGLDIRLSHHFAAMHLLPPPPVRLRAGEMRGWLEEQLTADFGAEVRSWRLAWQDVPPGRPVPVASLPADRYQALLDRLPATGVEARHVAPWFVSAWARHHRALGRRAAWLALAEPGRLVLARVEGGRPVGLGMSRLDAGSSLAAAVRRQALHLGAPAQGNVWLLALEGDAEWNMTGSSLDLRTLADHGGGWGRLLV